jgi:hypothetical protein
MSADGTWLPFEMAPIMSAIGRYADISADIGQSALMTRSCHNGDVRLIEAMTRKMPAYAPHCRSWASLDTRFRPSPDRWKAPHRNTW